MKNTLQIAFFIIVCELAGLVGAVFTSSSIPTWYSGLTKPDLAPPNFVFGPVWTTLYALMGISSYLIWKKGFARTDVKIALSVFAVQLVLNILWSFIFFGQKSLQGAFVEIIFLWLSILACIILFGKISKPASLLLIPYILWVTFAGYLNFSIWQLNKNTLVETEVGFWKSINIPDSSISFKYPETLPTKYTSTVDWPPEVQILSEEFSCTEAGSSIERAGATKKVSVAGREFCVTQLDEGAAGSTYSQYAYAFQKENKTVILTFTLRRPQCGNYDDPQKTECENERAIFDLNSMIAKIADSLKF